MEADLSRVIRAEQAVHARTALACDAASGAGLPGHFQAWKADGVMAVLASDPALRFLSIVSGVTRETLPPALELANDSIWDGVKPTVVVSGVIGNAGEAVLSGAGLVRTEDRVLAIRGLDDEPGPDSEADQYVSQPPTKDAFLDVLLAGYEIDGVIAAFLGAEHRLPAVRPFLLVEDDVPIAAAAMTIHDDVAVLGGASTLPAYRGRGAQSRLLRNRLRLAAQAGCTLAVATARPKSVSEANLRRAGFRVYRRPAWITPD